jgi:aspartyl-tRNA(Asn)/glutamyl-tRNA(Gln) amidotransferase subunit C
MVAMAISFDEVQHVAKLARLDLSKEELLVFQNELNALLGHFAEIEGADVAHLLAKPHAVARTNVFAEDFVVAGLARELAMLNAPKSRAGLFVVPTIIEE